MKTLRLYGAAKIEFNLGFYDLDWEDVATWKVDKAKIYLTLKSGVVVARDLTSDISKTEIEVMHYKVEEL